MPPTITARMRPMLFCIPLERSTTNCVSSGSFWPFVLSMVSKRGITTTIMTMITPPAMQVTRIGYIEALFTIFFMRWESSR
jgi:hypothetical protein